MNVLFQEMLEPKLNKPKEDGGGTYWGELQELIKSYNGCPADWVTRLDTKVIRRARQIDKFEPAVTYYVFAALSLATGGFKDVDRLAPALRRGWPADGMADAVGRLLARHGWEGWLFEALVKPPEPVCRAVRDNIRECPVSYARRVAGERPGVRFESQTKFDGFSGDPQALQAGSGEWGLGAEGKLTCDISADTTYSAHRNQIIRNVEVGNGRFRSFAFLLLTPRAYRKRRSRFYVYKMEEYQGDDGAEHLRRDALATPAHAADVEGWRRRTGWLDWEDLIAVAYPGGRPAFHHADAAALIDVLRERLLWPWD